MKVYISADIEGVTGVSHWDETDRQKPDYNEFREQMTAEVSAACEGALQAGGTEIWVKDAHASARKASFFPGAALDGPHTIRFEADDYFEVLRLFLFVL